MDICGVVTEGQFARQDINLTGPTQIEGGNWLFARIKQNDYQLVLNGGLTLGIRINGVKIDDFVLRTYKPLDQACDILHALLPGGQDAKTAWKVMVDIVHAETERMTWDAFRMAYSSAYSGLVYSGKLLEIVEIGGNLQGWDQVQDFIANHSTAQLMGEDTELVSEES